MMRIIEGFRAGKALVMMPKIINIINRRTSNDYVLSPMAGNWKDSRGSWSAYEAYSSTGEVLRFKFTLGKSDVIKEVEYLETYLDNKSKYVIDLEGFNIVQVLDYITDVLTGEFAKYAETKLAASCKRKSKSLDEAVKVADSIKKWILDNDLKDALGRMSSDRDFEQQQQQYNTFASQSQYKTVNSLASFKYHIKFNLKKLGVRNDIASVSVSAGGESSRIIDTAERTVFETDIIENEHLIKYQLMEIAIDRIRDGDPKVNGVYIYGTGGVGKSYYAKKELLPLSNVVYKSGNISGYTGVLQLVYENRHGMILVLDDIVSPSLMKNGNVENIFKAILDSSDPRHYELVKVQPDRSESFGKNKIVFNEEDFFDMDSLENFASQDGVNIEEDRYSFDFTSKVVFITNIPSVPEAFGDRVETINMILTNEQIMDVIKSKLEFLAQDVEVDDKYFFFNWLNENIKFAKKISFRAYDQGLRLYLAIKDRSNWENMIRVMLKSGVAQKY